MKSRLSVLVLAALLWAAPAFAAVSYNDKFLLSQDSGFRNRVQMSLVAACISIMSESPTSVVFHAQRSQYCVQVMNGSGPFSVLVATSVATDTSVINDATATGTVTLTSGNAATQAALVTDAHIDAAVSGQFNAFFLHPA